MLNPQHQNANFCFLEEQIVLRSKILAEAQMHLDAMYYLGPRQYPDLADAENHVAHLLNELQMLIFHRDSIYAILAGCEPGSPSRTVV